MICDQYGLPVPIENLYRLETGPFDQLMEDQIEAALAARWYEIAGDLYVSDQELAGPFLGPDRLIDLYPEELPGPIHRVPEPYKSYSAARGFESLLPESDRIELSLFLGLEQVKPYPVCWPLARFQAYLFRSDPSVVPAHSLWSPAVYRPGTTRANRNVQYLTCLVFDLDYPYPVRAARASAEPVPDWPDPARPETSADLLGRIVSGQDPPWSGLACLLHSTRSYDGPARCYWRAVLPLAQPVPVEAWDRFWQIAYQHFTYELADPSCRDPARFYYRAPHLTLGQPYFQVRLPGRRLNPTDLLTKGAHP